MSILPLRRTPGVRALALVVATVAAVAFGCRRGGPDRVATEPAPPAELLHQAVKQLTDVIVYDIFSPPQASRAYAYASIAAYEALRQGNPQYRTLAGQLNGLTPVPAPEPGATYSLPLAGVHAYLTVGRALTFSRARMDSARTAMDEQFRRSGIPADVYARSIAYGDRVAKHVLDWAAADRFKQTRGMPKFSITNTPGRWVPTPPAYMDAVEPNWALLRPFVLDSAGEFRPEEPYAWDTTATSAFMREAREVRDVSRTLTQEQKDITAFWDCNPYVMNVTGHTMFASKKITPGGHWMGIAAIASRNAHADVLRAAAVYARVSVALADGFISSWEAKYRTGVIRPETVINQHIDEAWTPLLQTPPFPEYTSGHSVISTAAAQVLTDEYGPTFAFVDSTEAEYGLPVRSFRSFTQAAAEAAISRLYGGIHYRHSIEQGAIQGRKVGELVVARVHTRTAPTVAAARPVAGTSAPGASTPGASATATLTASAR